MELRQAQMSEITAMRERRRRSLSLAVVPGFYDHLVSESVPYLISEVGRGALGYALLVERAHDGHKHVTVLEAYLERDALGGFEELLDLLREKKAPTAYLARSDDCTYDATLLARGLQVEPTALVMLGDGASPTAGRSGSSDRAGSRELVTLTPEHLGRLQALLEGGSARPGGDRGKSLEEMSGDLERMAHSGRDWVMLLDGAPVAVVARVDGGDGLHELLDLAVGAADEDDLAWALRAAGQQVQDNGLLPAAVIDALEGARHRLLRAAGFHVVAVYLVFYDPDAGRPSIGRVGLEELRGLLAGSEPVRLVDVMGEEHWSTAHIPGSEWIDFRGLAREARRRFGLDETIVLYCNGFT